jgi:hypothetical protein
MCLGAAESRGEVLLFLHADSTLRPGALDRINEVLSANAKIIGGNFRLVFDGDTRFSRYLTCALIRSLGHYYGDIRGSLSVARCTTPSAVSVRCR